MAKKSLEEVLDSLGVSWRRVSSSRWLIEYSEVRGGEPVRVTVAENGQRYSIRETGAIRRVMYEENLDCTSEKVLDELFDAAYSAAYKSRFELLPDWGLVRNNVPVSDMGRVLQNVPKVVDAAVAAVRSYWRQQGRYRQVEH